MSSPVKASPKKVAPAAGITPPPPAAKAPAGRGGAPPRPASGAPAALGGGGKDAVADACVKCGESMEGQKFCPKCGTMRAGAHTHNLVVSPRKGAAVDLDHEALAKRFGEVCKQDTEQQTELFLKSFILVLGDDWKVLLRLQKEYSKMLRDEGDNQTAMNEVQAMTFLQKNGAERTTIQRREEVRDIDLDNDQRISFIEYLLLQFKVMILTEFYKRHNLEPEEDLSKGGVGVTGVGSKLLDQLFNGVRSGTLPPELEKAIEDFTKMMRERNAKLNDLQAKSKGASVKAMAAANEIKQMEAEDPTEMNRIELTLNAAKKKALSSKGGEKMLEEKKKAELKAEEEKRKLSRDSLKEKAKLWQ